LTILESTLHPAAAIVTGLVGLGHGLGALVCLVSARRRPNRADRLRRLVLGLLLLIPAVLLLWYAARALLEWNT
jgi:hypothetical protein